MDIINKAIRDLTWIVFDTETSGAYPIGSEVIELGAIRFKGGDVTDKFQILIKPKKPIPDEIIAIHHIKNEDLESCLTVNEVGSLVHTFFDADVYIAHHAPFDLGFVTIIFERCGLTLPQGVGLCTSLLGRKLIKGVSNHRLQTLAAHYSINPGQAHRALDDAYVCGEVFKKILESLPPNITLKDLEKIQGYKLLWEDFKILSHSNFIYQTCVKAIEQEALVEIVYAKGTYKLKPRLIKPLGIVRTPIDNDYISAWCEVDQKKKRFFIAEIKSIQIVS